MLIQLTPQEKRYWAQGLRAYRQKKEFENNRPQSWRDGWMFGYYSAQQPREPDSLKAGDSSLPDVVKSESNLPAFHRLNTS